MNLTEVDREDATREDILDPELPIVDAHHHLWPTGYRIPYDSAALYADLGRGHNVTSTVFVECMTSYRSQGDEALRPVGETEFVVRDCPPGPDSGGTKVADGIVGWADLSRPEEVGRTLDSHLEAGAGRFRGIRFNVVWHERHAHHAGREVPRHFLLADTYRRSLREIERRGLTYDVWLFHPQLPELSNTLDAFPDLTFSERGAQAGWYWDARLRVWVRGCDPAKVERSFRSVDPLHGNGDCPVRGGPLHVREQLPGRQAEL
jgi:L-fuconolactonase